MSHKLSSKLFIALSLLVLLEFDWVFSGTDSEACMLEVQAEKTFKSYESGSQHLSCNSSCNEVECSFISHGSETFSFRVKLICATKGNSGVHSQVVDLTSKSDNQTFRLMSLDSFMRNETVMFDSTVKDGLPQSYPWAVLHTVHEDDEKGKFYLMISVGKAVGSASMDLMALKPSASFSRTIEKYEFICGSVKCTARAKKAEKLEESRKSFRDKDLEDCNSMQLTNNPRRVSVKVDQHLTCSDWNGNVFMMAYNVNFQLGGVAGAYVRVFHITEVERGIVSVPLVEAKDIFFSPESEENSVEYSYVGIGITNDLEIEAIWISKLYANSSQAGTETKDEDVKPTISQISGKMHLSGDCEKKYIEDDLSDAMTLNETADHAVCHSFSNAIDHSNMRRTNEKRSRRVRFSESQVQINCVASGCTDALCNIHVESPSDYATDASSDSFEKYDLKVEFSIPVCHQNMIMYTVYNMTDNRQVVIQDGMIGSVQGSNYHPIPAGVGSSKFFLSGSVYSLVRGASTSQPQVPQTISNLYFVNEECLLILDRKGAVFPNRAGGRSSGDNSSKWERKCFRRGARGYNLVMLSVPITLCDVSASLSPDQCEDLSAHMDNPTAGASSGSFTVKRDPEMSSEMFPNDDKVSYRCSVGDDHCDGIACAYDVRKLFDQNYLSDPGTLNLDRNEASINFRFEHCSEEDGLVVTVENSVTYSLRHRSAESLSSHTSSLSSQFFPTVFRKDQSAEEIALDMWMNGQSSLNITLLLSETSSSEITVVDSLSILPVVATTPVKIFNYSSSSSNLDESEGEQRYLSIFFKHKNSELIRQVEALPIGNSQCERSISTSSTCHKWKDASSKFKIPPAGSASLLCQSNRLCNGMTCTKSARYRQQSTVLLEFSSCLSPVEIRVREESVDDSESTGTAEVYSKGDRISSLNNAYFADFILYQECLVVILKTNRLSKSYMASVVPRDCPKLPESHHQYVKLEKCPKDLKDVLWTDESTIETVQLNYTLLEEEELEEPDSAEQAKEQLSEKASVSSSTLGPLMLGLFGVPVLVIGSAVVSLLICRGSARTFFSSSLPHQPLVESRYSSILRLDCNEDDNDLIDTS